MALINVMNLKVPAAIGTYDWEQKGLQDLYIDIELDVNIDDAIQTDDLNAAVDYESISNMILNIGRDSSFQLIEAFAGHIRERILDDKRIKGCVVRVRKPAAIPSADYVEVEINS